VVHYLQFIVLGHDDFAILCSEVRWGLLTFHEAEDRLFLLQVDCKDCSSYLEIVFEHFIQVEWSLNLHECSEFGSIIFNIELARIIFMYMGMEPTNGDIVNPYICVVPSSESNFTDIIKINNMNTPLLILLVFIAIDLK
jgi:hypothetical protein